MIKKFNVFKDQINESTLRDGREYKISRSKKSIESLNDLTEWYNDDKISFLDITNTGVSLRETEDSIINEQLILIKQSSFQLIGSNDVDLNQYRLFKILGVPENFPKYSIIKSSDFEEEKKYSTLNLNKLQRGDNIQEMVFIKLLGLMFKCTINTGIKEEMYNETWDDEITFYESHFPNNIKKMINQIDLLISKLGIDYSVIYKDSSDFFLNQRAKELFYENDEYYERGFKFNGDKWNPSDIWLLKGDISEYKKIVNEFETIEELNKWLGDNIENNENIIGISLKVNSSKRAWLNKVNLGYSPPFEHEYTGYKVSPTTMSVRIDYNYKWSRNGIEKSDDGHIDIRNFSGGRSSGVNLEIASKKGHMAGKATGILIPLFGNTNLFELMDVVKYSNTKEDLLKYSRLFALEEHISEDFMEILNNEKELDYKEKSKLQGLLIVNSIETHPKGADHVIHEIVNYGKSQSEISAPHYVLK